MKTSISTKTRLRQSNTVKRTFSIKKNLLEELNNFPNKSKIINEGLELVLKRKVYEEALDKKYKDDLDKFEIKDFEIERFTDEEYASLREKGGKVYDKISRLMMEKGKSL